MRFCREQNTAISSGLVLSITIMNNLIETSAVVVSCLESHLRGIQFGSNEGVIDAVNEYLGDQKTALYFVGIRKLEQRWAECIALKGDFIEN